MRRFAAAWLGVAACGQPAVAPPCQEPSDPTVDLVPADVAWGEFTDGDDVLYGNPPQGGAPYAPFRVRIGGVPGLDEAAAVSVRAIDVADGASLGEVDYDLRFTCANVGDSAGIWMAPDVHARFFGWSLDDLAGRDATIEVEIANRDGETARAAVVGHLVQMP